MEAVGYYDLSVASLPMHATCFRPTTTEALSRNPFRVFTTLLRPELLRSEEARSAAEILLRRRQMFTPELFELLNTAEKQAGHLTTQQAEIFIPQALLTFSWRPVASATQAEYSRLRNEHAILADIACFQSAHINHLTPRTLDIEAAQAAMKDAGMAVKSNIEGPPRRRWPILLRQTSFLALEEKVQFKLREGEWEGELVNGSHKARFGEVEERGAAVTPNGRKLYDHLLEEANARASRQAASGAQRDAIMVQTFAQFPDTWAELREQSLVYCKFELGDRPLPPELKPSESAEMTPQRIEALLAEGVLRARPITYEDFLPFSAAGIFQSNLQTMSSHHGGDNREGADLDGFERSLGCSVISADSLYADSEAASLRQCARDLGYT